MRRNCLGHIGGRLFSSLFLMIPMLAIPVDAFCDENEREMTIVDRINEESAGRVTIAIDSELLEQLMSVPESKKTPASRQTQGYKTSGYRIQVFSDGRNQHSLEARAKARGSAILARFPKYRGQVYTFSSSPNWYTRVGNFHTAAEASAALNELKKAFPQFAAEMRVVKSKIVNLK